MEQNIIGERIAGLLREQGKTQRELAEQVGTTEVSMTRYIKGDRVPKGPVLANIAKALHTTTDYLLGNEQDSKCFSQILNPTQCTKVWTLAMNVSLANDNELQIRFSKDTDEILALVKALKDLEEVIEKKAKLSKEQLLAAITNLDDNDILDSRKIMYAMNELKEEQKALSEIRNLIKCYSNDLNLDT